MSKIDQRLREIDRQEINRLSRIISSRSERDEEVRRLKANAEMLFNELTRVQEENAKLRPKVVERLLRSTTKKQDIEAEVLRLLKTMSGSSVCWDKFLVSGMPDSLKEVTRLIANDRWMRLEQPGNGK